MKSLSLIPNLPERRKNEPCCAPPAPATLSRIGSERLAARLKALGDPTRLHLLDVIVQQAQPLCVCDLTDLFELSQPTISHHLRLLREAGLIETEKCGIWSYYWATAQGRDTFQAVVTLA